MSRNRPGKVSELLNSEDRWTKDFDAVNQNGAEVGTRSPSACRWCLYGAIQAVYGGQDREMTITSTVHDFLRDHTLDGEHEYRGIGPWNDRPERTFAEVRAVIEALDI